MLVIESLEMSKLRSRFPEDSNLKHLANLESAMPPLVGTTCLYVL